jgi:peptidoglycan-associated lipoprotein
VLPFSDMWTGNPSGDLSERDQIHEILTVGWGDRPRSARVGEVLRGHRLRLQRRSTAVVLGLMLFVAAVAGCASCPPTPSASTPTWSASASPAPAPEVSASAPTPPASRALRLPPAPTNGFRTHEALRDVHFGPGRSDALWADTRVLDGAVGWLKENPTRLLRIEGYTDGSGTREQNLSIGEKRARFVMKYLVSRGVEAARIAVASYGADRPVCTETTEACRARNRRVQLLVKER